MGALVVVMILTGWSSTAGVCENAGFAGANSFTTCAVDENYAFTKVAMVVGNTANSPRPSLTGEEMRYLKNSLVQNAEVEIFSATPMMEKIERQKTTKRSGSSIATMVANMDVELKQVSEAVQVEPREDGVMYLEAISRAGRSIKSGAKNGDKMLILVNGSGLADEGVLNFAENDLLHRDVKAVYEQVVNSGEVVAGELDGVTVMWTGLGQTVAPQESLLRSEQDALEKIYRRILIYMGAEVIFDDTLLGNEKIQTKYQVKPTAVNTVGIVWEGSFDENSLLGFVPNAAEFIKGQDEAKRGLADAIKALKADKAAVVKVDGYVALGGCGNSVQASKELSQARAEAVQRIMVNEGVDAAKITATGRGHGEYNECENGQYNEEIARKNRIVKVTVEKK